MTVTVTVQPILIFIKYVPAYDDLSKHLRKTMRCVLNHIGMISRRCQRAYAKTHWSDAMNQWAYSGPFQCLPLQIRPVYQCTVRQCPSEEFRVQWRCTMRRFVLHGIPLPTGMGPIQSHRMHCRVEFRLSDLLEGNTPQLLPRGFRFDR